MIHGYCVGGGVALALAADIRYCADDARFSVPPARLGLGYPAHSLEAVVRAVGLANAKELLFTGRILDGSEAERIGLVNRVVDGEAVLPEAVEMARAMALSAPLAVRGSKRALARSLDSDLGGQLDFEAQQQSLCYETADLGEGLAAVREKRPPRFRGN